MRKRIGAITVLCAIIGGLVSGGAIGVFIGATTGYIIENQNY